MNGEYYYYFFAVRVRGGVGFGVGAKYTINDLFF
jgi:hypothetical protein